MIVGERTRLRAIENSDILAFRRWFNDPEVRSYLTRRFPISRTEEERWFEAQIGDESRRIFAIEISDGEHIGRLGLHGLDWKNRNAVCGIVIGEKQYWGQGYGTDALRTLVRFAFAELNLHRVSVHVYGSNDRAIRCYEKVGFRHEVRLRQARFVEGRYVDELIMGLLREEQQAGEGREVTESGARAP